MEWIAISGSGRGITKAIEHKIRETIQEIVSNGNGIITGGVLGVDYISVDEIISLNAPHSIKVCLPAPLELYMMHIRGREDITSEESEMLNRQLHLLLSMNPDAIISLDDVTHITKDSYNRRNNLVLSLAHKLIAFSINNSSGTEYTINRALELHIETEIHRYIVSE